MTTKYRPPGWFEPFQAWIGERGPAGTWLYRGQPAKYTSLAPSQLRDRNIKTYGNRLRQIDFGIADRLLATLLTLTPSPIHGHMAPGQPGEGEGSAAALFGGFREDLESLSTTEVIRGLAQHYGYPTMFVDLTLHPIVGAFFATHAQVGGRYQIIEDDLGVVYRWPVVRKNQILLHIPRRATVADEYDQIPAFDLRAVHPNFLRPRNQSAVMATVVFRPFRLNIPKDPGGRPILEVPIQDLLTIDLIKLPTCERFELPAAGGHDVAQLARVTEDALFPNRIDLGYAYMSVIALLSLCIHDPDVWGSGTHGEREAFEIGMLAGSTLLERECFRLVPGYSRSATSHRLTLAEATILLKECVKAAHKAAQLEISDYDAQRREIIPDIDRWFEHVTDIIAHTAKVPAYALQHPRHYRDFVKMFSSDTEYEAEVKRQTRAVEFWNRDLHHWLQ